MNFYAIVEHDKDDGDRVVTIGEWWDLEDADGILLVSDDRAYLEKVLKQRSDMIGLDADYTVKLLLDDPDEYLGD